MHPDGNPRRATSKFTEKEISFPSAEVPIVTSEASIISTLVDENQPKFLIGRMQVFDSRKYGFGSVRAFLSHMELQQNKVKPSSTMDMQVITL
jgi:hypothetical protein